MIATGADVHVAAADISSDTATVDTLTAMGVTYHDIPFERAGMNPVRDLRSMWYALTLMRKLKPDVFIGYTIKPVVFGAIAAKLARVPQRIAMITGLGFAFTSGESKKRLLANRLARLLYWVALRSVDTALFQNPDDRQLFKEAKLVPTKLRTAIINGSGVDLKFFEATGLPSAPTKFLMIARLLGDKGVREFAEAASIMRKESSDLEFHLAGGLDPNPDAIALDEVEGWVQNNTIIWHGHVDDVRSLLKGCHVYVLPSYREGTPRTVLEAMATGRAIITTDAPGCRETTIHGENGYLVPVKSVDALVDAMSNFVDKPDLVQEMGQASLVLVRKKFEKGQVARSIVKEIGVLGAQILPSSARD